MSGVIIYFVITLKMRQSCVQMKCGKNESFLVRPRFSLEIICFTLRLSQRKLGCKIVILSLSVLSGDVFT